MAGLLQGPDLLDRFNSLPRFSHAQLEGIQRAMRLGQCAAEKTRRNAPTQLLRRIGLDLNRHVQTPRAAWLCYFLFQFDKGFLLFGWTPQWMLPLVEYPCTLGPMTLRASGIFLITFTESANSDIQDPKTQITQCRVPSTLALQTWSRGKIDWFLFPNARNIYLPPTIYIHFFIFDCYQTSTGRLTEPAICAAESLKFKRRRSEAVQAISSMA